MRPLSDELKAEISGLQWIHTMEELRRRYPRETEGLEKCRRIQVMRYTIAYRLQERFYRAGLRPETARYFNAVSGDPMEPVGDENMPRKGTRIVRTWKGREYTAFIREDGQIEWEGAVYSSFSACARAITGKRCNGRMFFGIGRRLRDGDYRK